MKPLADTEKSRREQMVRLPGLDELSPGAAIAVAVGSREVAEIARITAAAVDALKERGFKPCIVPAMASHGKATDEEQAKLLAELGITETAVEEPIEMACTDGTALPIF